MLIEGKLYDVTNFKHPGGSVIKFLTDGGDATEAFEEFHGRSKKASLVLRGLPSRAAPPAVVKARGYNGREGLTKVRLGGRHGARRGGIDVGLSGSSERPPHSRRPHKPPTPCAAAATLQDYAILRKELSDEGFFDPSPTHVLYRVVR